MQTGIIGLGAMGGPMARHLERAGVLVAAWNRTRERAVGLLEDESLLLDQATEVAARSELLLLSVSRDVDVMAVVENVLSALPAGSIVVDTSTVSSDTAVKISAMLADHSVDFLDCPVSGGVEGARTATLSLMVGGSDQVLQRARPVLELLSKRIVHTGAIGSGQATKAVNQIMAAGINHAVTEALALGQTMGLDMGKVIEAVSSGAAANWFLDHRGASMLAGSFAPGFKVRLHAKDLGIASDLAAKHGLLLPVVAMTLRDYGQLMEQGHGDEDISSLFRIKSPVGGNP
ncbi:MAG: NAD(P)-dependent oxidoreductase [Candidatus Porifericomitaceae bacterium WSBS_2022_MAG_OTU9]